MEPIRPLAPCFVEHGTLTNPRDMVRALETLESIDFVWEVDGEPIAEGEATLVKLMADSASATMAVNGCLFLNVASFRYLDFTLEEGRCVMQLHGDGSTLTLIAAPERDSEQVPRGQLRMLEESMFDLSPFMVGDDEDDDD